MLRYTSHQDCTNARELVSAPRHTAPRLHQCKRTCQCSATYRTKTAPMQENLSVLRDIPHQDCTNARELVSAPRHTAPRLHQCKRTCQCSATYRTKTAPMQENLSVLRDIPHQDCTNARELVSAPRHTAPRLHQCKRTCQCSATYRTKTAPMQENLSVLRDIPHQDCTNARELVSAPRHTAPRLHQCKRTCQCSATYRTKTVPMQENLSVLCCTPRQTIDLAIALLHFENSFSIMSIP